MRTSATIELIGYVYGEPVNPMADKFPNFTSFSLSVTKKWKDKDGQEQKEVTWYKCQSWSEGLSKMIRNNIKHGMGLMVRGIPKNNAYIDKNCVAKSQIEVHIQDINMLTFPKDKPVITGSESNNDENGSAYNGRYEFEDKPKAAEAVEIHDDEIPF
jgi:single stranded DNA-binding protein